MNLNPFNKPWYKKNNPTLNNLAALAIVGGLVVRGVQYVAGKISGKSAAEDGATFRARKAA